MSAARPSFLVIAHRGAKAEREENTIAAFRRALDLGADMIETDLRLSRDRVVYIAHDVPASRTAGRPSWSELRAARGRSGRFPALDEVLERFAPRIALDLEIKEPAVGPVLAAALAASPPHGILVSSFERRTLCRFAAAAPGTEIAVLARRLPPRLPAALAALRSRTLALRRDAASRRAIARVHAAGARVLVWTVNDRAAIARLIDDGADGVFTDDPATALSVRAGG